MRVFAIKDQSLSDTKILGYLIYYEKAKSFYVELPDDADPWETPLLLSSVLKKGEHSIGSYWSRMWVEQRIIPQDRQNIGQILKENGLDTYDEFSLLMLTMGRCAQDECYLEEVGTDQLPLLLTERWRTKVEDVVPLEGNDLLVFFRDGEVKRIDMSALCKNRPAFIPYLSHPERFRKVSVQPDGHGIMWSEQAALSNQELYQNGVPVPLSLNDFISFVQCRVVSASEACQMLDCSRQNIDDLMKRGKLHPIRKDARYKLFLKNEVLQRNLTSQSHGEDE